MCPWLSGKKCLSCSTARVKSLLLFLADCAQWERQFGNKSVPGFSTRMSSWRKRFQSKWKIPPSTKCFISLLGTCNKGKESAQAGREGERLSFALCPRVPRASSLNTWPVWGRPVVSNPLPAWLKAGLFHKLSLLLKTVSSTLGFSVFWFEFPFLSWWSFAACKG